MEVDGRRRIDLPRGGALPAQGVRRVQEPPDRRGRLPLRGARRRVGKARPARWEGRRTGGDEEPPAPAVRARGRRRAGRLGHDPVQGLPGRRRHHGQARQPAGAQRPGQPRPPRLPRRLRLRGVDGNGPLPAGLPGEQGRRIPGQREARREQVGGVPDQPQGHRAQRRRHRQRLAARQGHGPGQRLERGQQQQPGRERRARRQHRPDHAAQGPRPPAGEPSAHRGERQVRGAARAHDEPAGHQQRLRPGRRRPDRQADIHARLRDRAPQPQGPGAADRGPRDGVGHDHVHLRGRRRPGREGHRQRHRGRAPLQRQRGPGPADQDEREARLRRRDDAPAPGGLDRPRRRPHLPQGGDAQQGADRVLPGDRQRQGQGPQPGARHARGRPDRLGRQQVGRGEDDRRRRRGGQPAAPRERRLRQGARRRGGDRLPDGQRSRPQRQADALGGHPPPTAWPSRPRRTSGA